MIKKAKRIRKLFGGGMRQAGIIAAAGTYALQNNINRLKEDHARAKVLGETLQNLPYVKQLLPVFTNIVVFEVIDKIPSTDLIQKLAEKGVKTAAFGPQQIRMVTHLDFKDAMLERVVEILKEV